MSEVGFLTWCDGLPEFCSSQPRVKRNLVLYPFEILAVYPPRVNGPGSDGEHGMEKHFRSRPMQAERDGQSNSREFRQARRSWAFEQGFADGPTFAFVQRFEILLASS